MGVDALDVRQHGDGGQSDQIPEQVVGARGRTTLCKTALMGGGSVVPPIWHGKGLRSGDESY